MRHAGSAISTLAQWATALAAALSLVPLPGTRFFTGSLFSTLILFFVASQASHTKSKLAGNILLLGTLASLSALVLVFLGNLFSGQDYPPNLETAFVAMAVALSAHSLIKCSLIIGARLTAILAAIPLIAFDYIQRSGQGNFWKYAIGISVSFLILFLLQDARKSFWMVAAFSVVCVSLFYETRSIAALLLLASAIEFSGRKLLAVKPAVRVAIAFSSLSIAYLTFYNLLISGTFGSSLAAGTISQSQGNPLQLVTGARPEAQGNANVIMLDLFRLTPGQSLTFDQAALIRNSFSLSNRDTNSEYVNYLFQANEFHSVFTDLWFHLGLPGVFLGILLIVYLSRRFFDVTKTSSLSSGNSFSLRNIVILYVILRVFSDLAFSPLSDTRVWPLYFLAFLPFVPRGVHDKS